MGNLTSSAGRGDTPQSVPDRGEEVKKAEPRKKWWLFWKNKVQPEMEVENTNSEDIRDMTDVSITMVTDERLTKLFTTVQPTEMNELKVDSGEEVSPKREKFEKRESKARKVVTSTDKSELKSKRKERRNSSHKDNNSANGESNAVAAKTEENTLARRRDARRRDSRVVKKSKTERERAYAVEIKTDPAYDDLIERTMAARRERIVECRKRSAKRREARAANQHKRTYEESLAKLRAMAKIK